MRTLLSLTLAFLPLVLGQDALLKSVEPDYDKYSPHLVADFETVIAPVTMVIAANGKPFGFNSVPLPMAVVMALKDYEFRPQGTVPHGRAAIDGATYEVTLNMPIRQSKTRPADPIRIGQGVSKGMVLRRVQPIYPEYARHNRIQGTVVFEAAISQEGIVRSLTTSSGPFLLIEAAYDAVRQWQYRPYLLKGEPIEVLTEIEVGFRLN